MQKIITNKLLKVNIRGQLPEGRGGVPRHERRGQWA